MEQFGGNLHGLCRYFFHPSASSWSLKCFFPYSGKCMSKYHRIMMQFKQYKHVSNLSGAGINCVSGKVLLDESVWSDLIKATDKNTQSMYRGFQRNGFAHRDICSLLPGDTLATGASGGTLEDFVTSNEFNMSSAMYHDPVVPVVTHDSVNSSTDEDDKPNEPPSQRIDKRNVPPSCSSNSSHCKTATRDIMMREPERRVIIPPRQGKAPITGGTSLKIRVRPRISGGRVR